MPVITKGAFTREGGIPQPKDGGAAFPQNGSVQFGEMSLNGTTGMSLRDYFAATALANLNLQAHVAKPGAEALAQSAYIIADAMLAERAK